MNLAMQYDKSWALRKLERQLYGNLANHPALPRLEWKIEADLEFEWCGPINGFRIDKPLSVYVTFGLEPGSLWGRFDLQGRVYWFPEVEEVEHSLLPMLPDGWEDLEGMEPMEWESMADQFTALFFEVQTEWDKESIEALLDILMARKYEEFLARPNFDGCFETNDQSPFESARDMREMTCLAHRTVRMPRGYPLREPATILLAGPEFRPYDEVNEIVLSFSPGMWESEIHEEQALNLLRSGFEGDLAALKATVNGMMADPHRSSQED